MKRHIVATLCLCLCTACGDDDDTSSSEDRDASADDDTGADDDTADDDTGDDDTGDDDTGDDDTGDDDTGDDDTMVDDDTMADDDVPMDGGAMGDAGTDGVDWDDFVANRPDYSEGQNIFRHDTFGTEVAWTDTLRMHEVISTAVDPMTALAVGLKVDAEALPEGILEQVDLSDPATTVALLQLDAVLGVKGTVNDDGELIAVGITCALCHSTVDDSVMAGIGARIDGPANRDLDPGLILSLSPAFDEEAQEVLTSWGPGRFDPRYNQDGINGAVLIPPIYGLDGVELETYTGDGPIGYWNNYVAVTQMLGIGSFEDERLGISIEADPDYVTPQLPALVEYEMSLTAPEPPEASFDAEAATRGQALFEGAAQCSTCHGGDLLSDVASTLHDPAETGMDPEYAERSATGQYRATPLRALFDHAPYFHDGSAETLADVIEHYDVELDLGLSNDEKADLEQYLLSL